MVILNSFSVLQQRNVAVLHVDLSLAMDICAIVTEDILVLFRTISWERIYHVKCSDVFGDRTITAVAFSLVGKCLSLGFVDGSVALLDIETTDIISSKSFVDSETLLRGGYIQSMAWQKQHYTVKDMHKIEDRSWLFGGLNQIQRAGMSEYSDPSAAHTATDSLSIALTSPSLVRRELVLLLSEHLLLSLTNRGFINCHIIGVFPLYRVSLQSVLCSLSLTSLVADSSINGASVLVGGMEHANRLLVNALPSTPLLHHDMQWLEQAASLHLCIELDLARLQEVLLGCGRKWKDSVKVVLPKLSLLQTLLDTYQMTMSPVEFCYTISLCGLWHPAAATAFSQHWNDQGIQRLRATVDSTGRSIIKLLQTKALPMATNCLLAARELLAVTERLYRSQKVSYPPLQDCEQLFYRDLQLSLQLVVDLEQMIMKLDEALLEARLAHETMLLYIQFIKDCTYDVAAAENPTNPPAGTKPDLSLRVKYQKLFDPRCKRAASKGASAQAEHVTGTHLYAFLQDASAASVGAIVASRSSSSSSSTGCLSATTAPIAAASAEEEICNMAAHLARNNLAHCAGLPVDVADCGDFTGQAHNPLSNSPPAVVHFIKTAKEVALSLSRSLHDTVSSQLQKCVDSPASVGSSETLKTILAIGNSSQNSTQEAHSPLLTSASLTAAEVTVQFADQCLVLQGGDHPAGAGAGAAVWEDFQAKQRGNEEGEGGGADESGNTLKSCLFTACVTDSALLVLAHQYGDAGLQNFGATTDALYYYYCAAFSLDSLLQAMAKGEEGGDAEDSMDQDGSSTPYTTAHIRSSKMSLYNRPQPAGASSVSSATSSNISVLLALELNQCDEKLSGSGGDSSVFLLKIPLENVVFTPIRSSHAPSKPDLSLDTLAAVSRQAVSEDDFKCRQLPSLHSLGRVCARGERGVALVGDCAGKVVILDMEADDDEDDEDEEEEDYEVNGSEGEDREDADGSRKNQSAESSGADMSTSSS